MQAVDEVAAREWRRGGHRLEYRSGLRGVRQHVVTFGFELGIEVEVRERLRYRQRPDVTDRMLREIGRRERVGTTRSRSPMP